MLMVGCMALLGNRLPNGLRVMLLTLAIADDIGAILVIAIGYSDALNYQALAMSFAGIALFVTLLKLGVRNNLVYLLMGFWIWFEFHASGIHATVSGVIIGLMTPIRSWVSPQRFNLVIQRTMKELEVCNPNGAERYALISQMQRSARDALSPLERLETELHPWVGFIIMPLFALANAGVALDFTVLRDPVSVAVMPGLFFGKPLGIFIFSWLAVKFKLARLPDGATWPVLAAGGILGGIGFTMALFIGGLALSGELLDAAKVGIMTGSALSAVVGMTLIIMLRRKTPADAVCALDDGGAHLGLLAHGGQGRALLRRHRTLPLPPAANDARDHLRTGPWSWCNCSTPHNPWPVRAAPGPKDGPLRRARVPAGVR